MINDDKYISMRFQHHFPGMFVYMRVSSNSGGESLELWIVDHLPTLVWGSQPPVLKPFLLCDNQQQ